MSRETPNRGQALPDGIASPYAGQERRQAPRWPVSRMCLRCGDVTPSSADALCATCDGIANRMVDVSGGSPARGFVFGGMLALGVWLGVIILCLVIT